MSKPDKISIETKKDTCYYKSGVLQSTGWKYGAKKICCWLGRQIKTGKAGKDREGKKTEKAGKDREGRQRQGRQTKTEKAGKDREGRQRQRRQKDREGKKDRESKKTEKAGKDREGRQRQRRQAKTEKAKKQTGIFRNIRTSQRQAGSYRTKNQLEIRQVGTLDCYSTCQCSTLLNGVFVIWNSFHV